MTMKRSDKALVISLLFMFSLLILTSCKVSGKKDLIRYAKQEYGDCEFISEEHKGSGNKEKRTVIQGHFRNDRIRNGRKYFRIFGTEIV